MSFLSLLCTSAWSGLKFFGFGFVFHGGFGFGFNRVCLVLTKRVRVLKFRVYGFSGFKKRAKFKPFFSAVKEKWPFLNFFKPRSNKGTLRIIIQVWLQPILICFKVQLSTKIPIFGYNWLFSRHFPFIFPSFWTRRVPAGLKFGFGFLRVWLFHIFSGSGPIG